MSTWLFDLGNTRLKCALLRGDGGCGDVHAVAHADVEIERALVSVVPDRFDRAVVAGVASAAVTAALLDALTRRTHRITRVRTAARWGDMRIAYAQPERLGVDRFLALIGARDAERDVLVCGVGTALTLDLIDRDGLHHGGRIAPSPTLMREVLHQRAAQLPVDTGTYVEFADDTSDALASGCAGAAIALVERSLEHARQRLGREVRLVLHGGGASALQAHLPDARLRPDLVFEGLARWSRDEAGTAQGAPLQSDPC